MRSTSARQMERTRTRPCSVPDMHTPRQKPSSRAPQTTAHASSRISRRSVCSHDSSPSGRPPGQPHRSPSLLISTTWLSCVTQNALAPCLMPGGALTGGCHSMNHVPPFERTVMGSRSLIGGGQFSIIRMRNADAAERPATTDERSHRAWSTTSRVDAQSCPGVFELLKLLARDSVIDEERSRTSRDHCNEGNQVAQRHNWRRVCPVGEILLVRCVA
jgi:hypothetical protein